MEECDKKKYNGIIKIDGKILLINSLEKME